jgi:hypothetical protein
VHPRNTNGRLKGRLTIVARKTPSNSIQIDGAMSFPPTDVDRHEAGKAKCFRYHIWTRGMYDRPEQPEGQLTLSAPCATKPSCGKCTWLQAESS